MQKKGLNLLIDLAALVAGCALPLAFAPFRLFPLAYICPAALLLCIYSATPNRALRRGALFGVGFFGIGVSWVYIAMRYYGHMPGSLALLATFLFVCLLSFCIALLCYIGVRFFAKERLLIAFPALWVIMEWVRGTVFTGFPWLLLGYSQTDTSLGHLAPLFGVYGVSLTAMIIASVFAAFILLRQRRTYIIGTIILVVLWLPSWGLSHYAWSRPTGKTLKVSLVQGNISRKDKWETTESGHILSIYRKLTEKLWDSDLIIWPEGAVPLTQRQAKTFIDALHKKAKSKNATIIFGITVEEAFHYYNALLMIGAHHGTYLKRHLVPFGEYIPLRPLTNWLPNYFQTIPDHTHGPAHQHKLYVKGVMLSPVICYEIAYPSLLIRDFPEAQLIVSLSDDSWFGHAIALEQHLQIGQMRALETAHYALLSTNTGITAVIDSKGNVVKRLPSFKRAVLTAKIPILRGGTPFMYYHSYVTYVILGLFLILARLIRLP